MKVLISGGGTGGHIFPALSIANALRRRDPEAQILFVGALGRMEMERVPAAGYEIVGLPVAGFDRRRLWRNFAVLLRLVRSLRMARRVLRDFRPDIVVGVGGYASGPTLKQAQKAHIPTLLQEQNSFAGVTNKLLAQKADAICVAYDGMERFFPASKILKTGNPVREAITACTETPQKARQALGFDPERPLVVVVGGSLGAHTINQSILAALPDILATGASVLWQTGKYYAAECQAAADAMIKEYGPTRLQVLPFLSRMDLAYRAATVMVSRAGASTISEIQLVGAVAILVPSPNVAEDHQRHNAEALASRGAAPMVLDADAPALLGSEIIRLLDNSDLRASIAQNARLMALANADDAIVDQIYKLVKRNEK